MSKSYILDNGTKVALSSIESISALKTKNWNMSIFGAHTGEKVFFMITFTSGGRHTVSTKVFHRKWGQLRDEKLKVDELLKISKTHEDLVGKWEKSLNK